MVDVIGRAKVIVTSEVDSRSVTTTGSAMGNLLGGALKKTAVAAGAGIGALVGTAIYKGFSRLSAIEEAEAKLKGLGNSTKTVATIMENSLASVKGTAFGLGDAATIAASAVASGVKPGQDLERTLRLVADAATIGGTSLEEMGAIFNKVSATGKAQGEVLNQLGERGIPIIQLLSKSLGVTAEEVVDLASQGKISFAEFQTAIEDGMGGAALKSGETFKGSLANAGAALGRFGAALLGPEFKDAPGVFQAITTKLDDMTPAAQRAGEAIHDFLQNFKPAEPIGTGTVLAPNAKPEDDLMGLIQQDTDEKAEEAGRSGWQKFLRGWLETMKEEAKTVGGQLMALIGFGISHADIGADIKEAGERFGGQMHEQWDKMIRRLKKAFTDFGTELKEAWHEDIENIKDGFDNIMDSIRAFPKRVTSQVNAWRAAGHDLIVGFFKGLGEKVSNKFGDIVQGIKDAINNALPDTITFFGGKGGIPAIHVNVPQFASGVQNFGGGLALVGERGPELVSLPKGSDVYSNQESQGMAGNTQNYYITGPVSLAELRQRAAWYDTYGTRFGTP